MHIYGQFLKCLQFDMNSRIAVRNICLAIQELCLKIFHLFENISRHNLMHFTAGQSIIGRRQFEISAYLVLVLFTYKYSSHHCSVYASYIVLSFCKNNC